MSSDLLAAVLAAPDDDGPRLVYADWLDEHGEPERAEFIRVQVESASLKLPKTDPRMLELQSRETVLLHNHRSEWMAPFWKKNGLLHARSSHTQFVRGFVEIIWMTALTFLKRGETLMQMTPFRELRCTRASTEEMRHLIEASLTGRLTALDLSGRLVGDEGAALMANSSHLMSIRRLRLQQCGIGNLGANSLANCSYFWPLIELDIAFNSIAKSEVEALRKRYGEHVVFSHWRRD